MGKGLPPNWEKHGERNHPKLGKEIHYFNPARLERVAVTEHEKHFYTHHKKYKIESSIHGKVDSADTIDEARRKANEYMNNNIAFS